MPRRSKGVQLYQRPPKRKGGQWRWVILDPSARPREISTGAFGDDRATAEKKFAEYLAKKHKPNFGKGDPAKVMIADVLSFYAQHQADKGKRNDNIALALMMLGKRTIGMAVDEITPVWCAEYVEWRINQGDARGANMRGGTVIPRLLKTSTARNDLVVLDAAQRFAWKNRKLTHIVPITKPKVSEPRQRFLTKDEAARLLRAALGWEFRRQADGKWTPVQRHHNRINYHLARFILVGLYTGTRHDRIIRLHFVESLHNGWVDLENGILHRKGKAEPETNKRAPSVPVGDRLLAHMRRWYRCKSRYVVEYGGRPVRGVFDSFEAACRLAGLNYDGQEVTDRVTPHVLRHSCATWMLLEGKSPYQVGRYIGMSAAMVERTYGHVTDDALRATANVIGRRNIASPVPPLSHTSAQTSVNKRRRT
jgi:integrase